MTTPAPHGLRPADRSLPLALLRARENVMRRFRPVLAAHGLTEQQWRVLRVLDVAPGSLSVGEVADRAVLLGPSVSRILAALENRGMVDRRHHDRDARVTEIELTSAGRRMVAHVAPTSESIYRALEAEFGRGDLRRLEAALDRLAHLR